MLDFKDIYSTYTIRPLIVSPDCDHVESGNLNMKKILIFGLILCFAIIIIGAGVCLMFVAKSTAKNGTLNINGKNITSENVTIHKEKYSNPVLPFPNSLMVKIQETFDNEYYYYAELPFMEVLKSLGFYVEWVDKNTAVITYNDERYILNLTEKTLIEEGKEFDILTPPPGGSRYVYKALEEELILSSDLIYSAMYLIEKKIAVNIDYDKSIVSIWSR